MESQLSSSNERSRALRPSRCLSYLLLVMQWRFVRSPARTHELLWDLTRRQWTTSWGEGSWFLRRQPPREQREPAATQLLRSKWYACVRAAGLSNMYLVLLFFYVTAESIQTLDEPMCSVSLRISLRTRKQLSLRKTSLLCLLSCVSSIDRVQAKVKRVTRV